MRLSLLDTSQITYGPYDWKLVREFFAYGLIEGYLACEVGADKWVPLSSITKISNIPESMSERVARYLAMPVPAQATELQREVLASLKVPPFTASVNRYVVDLLIARVIKDQGVTVDAKTLWWLSAERGFGWKLDPATQKQRDYLKSQGVKCPSSMTKGEASCLISTWPATDAQWRRLRFFRCPRIPFLTKQEAMELIEAYLARFPEAESEYQRWKADTIVEAPPSSKPSLFRRVLSLFSR